MPHGSHDFFRYESVWKWVWKWDAGTVSLGGFGDSSVISPLIGPCLATEHIRIIPLHCIDSVAIGCDYITVDDLLT